MRYLTALSLAIALGAGSAPALDRLNPRATSLNLLLRSDSEIAPGVLESVEKEVRTIFSGTALELQFEEPNQPGGTYSWMAVLRFHGVCAAGPVHGTPATKERPVRELGTTHIVEGAIIPFADIECDAVRRTLGIAKSGTTALDEPILGRALGRVVAHELYHILLKDEHHGRGLAAAAFSRSDLVAAHRSFDAADLNRMASSLLGETRAAEAPRPRLPGAGNSAMSFLDLH